MEDAKESPPVIVVDPPSPPFPALIANDPPLEESLFVFPDENVASPPRIDKKFHEYIVLRKHYNKFVL